MRRSDRGGSSNSRQNDPVDEFVNGLTVIDADGRIIDVDDHSSLGDPDSSTDTQQDVDRSARRALQWVLTGGVAVLMLCIGNAVGLSRAEQSSSDAEPEPAITITVTETKQVLPDSCARVMAGWEKYLDNAVIITSANGVQLDIFAEAYQAILQKDWQKLNQLSERQRALEHKLSPDQFRLMPTLDQLRGDIKQCQEDVA